MKTKIVLQKAVLESAFTMEQLKKVEKFNPEMLTLVDMNDEPMFKMATGLSGSVGKYGVTFNQVATNGKAAVEVEICGTTEEEKKRYVAEELGNIIRSINEVEKYLEECLDDIDMDINTIMKSTEVIA